MKRNILIYIDESRQVSERYMVLGGIITSNICIEKINSKIDDFRAKNNLTREFKWTKISNYMIDKYLALIDISFEFFSKKTMFFKSIIIDSREFDHHRFSDGNVEVTFYKLMYQLIIHKFGKYFDNESKVIIHFDKRSSSYVLSDLLPILNGGIKKKYGLNNDVIRSLEPIDSKTNNLIQIADIFMGAIGYIKNGWDQKEDASPCKVKAARHIATALNLPNLSIPTPIAREDFEIWHFRFNRK